MKRQTNADPIFLCESCLKTFSAKSCVKRHQTSNPACQIILSRANTTPASSSHDYSCAAAITSEGSGYNRAPPVYSGYTWSPPGDKGYTREPLHDGESDYMENSVALDFPLPDNDSQGVVMAENRNCSEENPTSRCDDWSISDSSSDASISSKSVFSADESIFNKFHHNDEGLFLPNHEDEWSNSSNQCTFDLYSTYNHQEVVVNHLENDRQWRRYKRDDSLPSTDLSQWEEKLMHIIKDNGVPIKVFDEVMKWACEAAKQNYTFNGPTYLTVLRKMIHRYKHLVGDIQTKTAVDVGSSLIPVHIYKFDAKQHIQRLLLDEDLMKDALWEGDGEPFSHNGHKQYGELNTGSWWNDTEKRMHEKLKQPDHFLCPLIFFIDGTLADALGRLHVEPVLLTLGNIRSKKRRTDKAQILLGFIPSYPKTSEERDKDRRSVKTKSSYMQFYHQCLEVMLADVMKLCNECNGVLMNVVEKGQVYLHFEVAMFLGDTQGQDILCCMYGSKSADVTRLCRECDISARDADKIQVPVKSFNRANVESLVNDAIRDIMGKRNLGKARSNLKSISTHPVVSSLTALHFGGDPQGIYGCTPYESLHVFLLGILKYLLQSVYNYFPVAADMATWTRRRYSQDRIKSDQDFRKTRPTVLLDSQNSKVDKATLEKRIRLLRIHCNRQSDRNVPRTPFNHGVTQLKKLSGQEYPGLCLLTMLTIEGLLGDSDAEEDFSLLLWLSLSIEQLLTCELYTDEQLHELDRKITLYMKFYRSLVGPQRELISKCGLRLSKFHALTKSVKQIRKFGSADNFFGGFLESALKSIVKNPTKRTNRQQHRHANDLMTRWYEAKILLESKKTIADQFPIKSADPPIKRLESVDLAINKSVSFTMGSSNFFCRYNDRNMAWETWIQGRNQCRLYHPEKDDEVGNSWVAYLCEEAKTLGYSVVQLGFRLDISVTGDALHDTFRCHPDFHSNPWAKRGWFDFAMRCYENDHGDVYKNAIKILLWGEMSGHSVTKEEGKVIGVAYQFQSHHPVPKHHMLKWLTADYLTDNLEIVEPDSIEAAYVLPAMPPSHDGGYDSNEESTFFGEGHNYFVIFPPRSKWGDIGWEEAERIVQRKRL